MSQAEGSTDRGKMVRNAGIVGGATVISSILGLLRDSVLAFMLGATLSADAFFVAFRIPNLARQLFGEGALAASFVPVYTDVLQRDGEEPARRFSGHLFSLLVITLTVLTIAGIFFAPVIVRLIALGFDPGSGVFATTVLLTRWMLPYMVFICAAALGMGILNSHGHFFTPAIAPALLNISIIVFAFFVAPGLKMPVLALAWGVLVGGVLQLLVQYLPMKRMKPWCCHLSGQHPRGHHAGFFSAYRQHHLSLVWEPNDAVPVRRFRDCSGHGRSSNPVATDLRG